MAGGGGFENGEAAMSERGATVAGEGEARVIGSAMSEPVAHGENRVRVDRLSSANDAGDSTHARDCRVGPQREQ
jgi:hypothetical protein